MDTYQTQICIAVLMTGVVICSITIFFAFSILKQKRRIMRLQQQNLLTVMNTLERERTRIAADLHDDLGVTLSFVKFLVGSVDTDNVKDQAVLIDASTRLDEAAGKVRLIAHNLMPVSLKNKGLLVAIAELVQLVNRTTTVEATLEAPSRLPLGEAESMSLFRMVQEVVQNTLKHAAATQLLIRLKVIDKHVHLLYEDNGAGFKTSHESKKPYGGIGVENLRTRARLLNGEMKLHSEPGRGTQYQFTIPIKRQPLD